MWTCFTCFLRLKPKDVMIRMVDLFEITIAHVLNWANAQTSQRNCFAGPFLKNSPRIALTCYSISTSIAVFLSISLFYTTLYSNPLKHCENKQLIVPFRSKTTISVVLVTKRIPNIFPIYIYTHYPYIPMNIPMISSWLQRTKDHSMLALAAEGVPSLEAGALMVI